MLLSSKFFFQAELEFSLLKCSALWFLTQSLVLQPPFLANSSVPIDSFKNVFVADSFVLRVGSHSFYSPGWPVIHWVA